ncbi:MAG: carbohydrate ABC transporter permease [Gammaproteobacteria bacterium]|nr:MAG: carbohydrate ABC transporter permease [Gammaproteobacteria bacterium]
MSLTYIALLMLAMLFLSPILFMLIGSLKPDTRVLMEAGSLKAFVPVEVGLDNYRDVFARVDFGRYLVNSLFITGMVVLMGLVVNSMAGYAFARLEWRGRKLLFALVLAILILPLEAIAVPLFYQVTMFGWRDTYLVQILPFIANAFSIYLFYTFFLGLPRELEDAARIDGAGVLRTFIMIIVPNSKPAFATVAILTFLMQWGIFLWPLMVTSGEAVRPLPLAIATFYTLPPLQWGDIFAFGVLMVLPILLVFLFFQRWFVRGVVATGIKG